MHPLNVVLPNSVRDVSERFPNAVTQLHIVQGSLSSLTWFPIMSVFETARLMIIGSKTGYGTLLSEKMLSDLHIHHAGS